MDKYKKVRITGHKNNKLGKNLNIHDKNGIELKVGDKIQWQGEICRIFWNVRCNEYQAFICRSLWYGDKDEFNPNCYGKSYHLPMDNGSKMCILKMEGYNE